MDDFGGALQALREAIGPFMPVLPTLPHVEAEVRARAALWPQAPKIVLGEAQKFEAFRTARAALAASGTVTLELALAGAPMVGAYKVGIVEEQLKYLIKVPSILLPNLILGDRSIPEKLQKDCNPAALAAALSGRGARRASAAGADRGAGAARRPDAARRRRRAERARRARGARDDRVAPRRMRGRRREAPAHSTPGAGSARKKDDAWREWRGETRCANDQPRNGSWRVSY